MPLRVQGELGFSPEVTPTFVSTRSPPVAKATVATVAHGTAEAVPLQSMRTLMMAKKCRMAGGGPAIRLVAYGR